MFFTWISSLSHEDVLLPLQHECKMRKINQKFFVLLMKNTKIKLYISNCRPRTHDFTRDNQRLLLIHWYCYVYQGFLSRGYIFHRKWDCMSYNIYIYIYINYQSGAAPCLTQNHPDLQYKYIYIADKGRLHV